MDAASSCCEFESSRSFEAKGAVATSLIIFTYEVLVWDSLEIQSDEALDSRGPTHFHVFLWRKQHRDSELNCPNVQVFFVKVVLSCAKTKRFSTSTSRLLNTRTVFELARKFRPDKHLGLGRLKQHFHRARLAFV